MVHHTEKRANPRNLCKIPATIEELKDSFLYRARLVNYSNNGMFLETDVVLDSGAEILIGIEDSLFSSPSHFSDGPACYRARIIWQKDTAGSIFNFGYGAQIVPDQDKKGSQGRDLNKKQELREHPRRPCSKPVVFASDNQYYKGSIKNISRRGIFVEIKGAFTVGQIIKLGIPGTSIDKGIMLKGEVVHLGQTGIGVNFKSLLRKKDYVKDMGGRRSGDDRGKLFFSEYSPENRSDKDRRRNLERRKLKNLEHRKSFNLSDAFKSKK
jgi:Tfp pilus assembly protein PilZ